MNSKELAEKLNGREHKQEITKEEMEQAKEDSLVVAFGWDDNITEFTGAIFVWISYQGGDKTFFREGKALYNECKEYHCPYFRLLLEEAKSIESIWDNCPYLIQVKKDDESIGDVLIDDKHYFWKFKTDIPHEKFYIFEDGKLHCEGIVFSTNDLKK